MNRLPVVSGREPAKALSRFGFALDRQKGSHMILFRCEPPLTVVIPDHKELDRGLLRAILRQSGLSPEQLTQLLA